MYNRYDVRVYGKCAYISKYDLGKIALAGDGRIAPFTDLILQELRRQGVIETDRNRIEGILFRQELSDKTHHRPEDAPILEAIGRSDNSKYVLENWKILLALRLGFSGVWIEGSSKRRTVQAEQYDMDKLNELKLNW